MILSFIKESTKEDITDYPIEYTCRVCMELFQNPFILVPCGHTLCEKCNSKISECPYCKKNITNIVKNYAVINIIEARYPDIFNKKEKFKNFLNEIFKDSVGLKNILLGDKLGKTLKERILVISELFSLKKSLGITTLICEEDEYSVYKANDYIYMSYNNIIMIDIDHGDMENLPTIKKELIKTGESFELFQSNNGFHAFVTSRYFDLDSEDTLDFLCSTIVNDSMYALFVWLTKKTHVRLNRKNKETLKPGPLYKYICTIGHNSKRTLADLVFKHNTFTECFKNIQNTGGKPSNRIVFKYKDICKDYYRLINEDDYEYFDEPYFEVESNHESDEETDFDGGEVTVENNMVGMDAERDAEAEIADFQGTINNILNHRNIIDLGDSEEIVYVPRTIE
jgi:hypothetical protein